MSKQAPLYTSFEEEDIFSAPDTTYDSSPEEPDDDLTPLLKKYLEAIYLSQKYSWVGILGIPGDLVPTYIVYLQEKSHPKTPLYRDSPFSKTNPVKEAFVELSLGTRPYNVFFGIYFILDPENNEEAETTGKTDEFLQKLVDEVTEMYGNGSSEAMVLFEWTCPSE